MNTASDKVMSLAQLGKVCALIVASLAALSLWSWGAGLGQLFAFTPEHKPMAPSTAFCFELISVALLLRGKLPTRPLVARFGTGVVAIVALVGAFACVRTWFGWSSPVEAWLSQTSEQLVGNPVGQMWPWTGAVFCLAAAAFWLQSLPPRPWSGRWWLAGALALVVLLAGAGVVVSYVADRFWFADSLEKLMALSTAISFVLLGGALLGDSSLRLQPAAKHAPPPHLIHGRNATVILITASLALAMSTVTALYLRNEQGDKREEARQLMDAIANLKLAQIVRWRQERLNDARFFAQADFVTRDVHGFFSNPAAVPIRTRLLCWLTLLKGGDRYVHVALLDANGELRLSVPQLQPTNAFATTGTGFGTLTRTNDIAMSDLYRGPASNDIRLDLTFPIFASQGQATNADEAPPLLLGHLLIRVDPYQFLYPMLQSWPTPSRTAEAILFRCEGDDVVFLNELRHRTNSALTMRFPIESKSDLPAVKALLNGPGQFEGRDYRGVPVLTDIRSVPDSPWFLVTKVDSDEIYAPLREQAWMTLAFTAVLSMAAGLLVGLVSKRRQAQRAWRELAAERHQLALAQRVEHLMKNANDAILLADEGNNILEANDRALQLYGYALVELQTMKLPALHAPESRAEFPAAAERLLANGQAVFEALHQRKNGSVFPVEISSSVIEVAGVHYKLGFLRDITDRKRAEESLRAERDFSAGIIRGTPAIICGIAPDGTTTFINPAGEVITGYRSEEIVGKNWWQVFYPGDEDRQVEKLFRDFERGDVKDYEMTLTSRGGGKRIVSWNSVNRYDQTGRIIEVVGFGNDVTERKRSETALRESKERLKLALAASRMGVWEWDLQTNAVICSPECYNIVGLKPQNGSLTLDHFMNLVHPEDQARIRAAMEEAIANHTVFNAEFRIIRPDGSVRWLADDARASYDAEGKPLRFVGIVQDITARKLAETEIRKLSRAMEQSPALIVITDTAGQIEYTNPKFTEVTGYTAEEVRGKRPSILKSGATSSEEYRNLWQTIRKGGEWRGEFHNKKKNGEIFWESASISPILDEAGCTTHFIAVKEDITERKRLESQFRQAQKMEAVGQLAGGVAHDFNNILAAVMMLLGLLRDVPNLDPFLARSLKELQAEALRAAGLTRQLLLFSRRSVMQVKALDVNEVVENLLKMLRRLIGEQITLDWQGRSQLPAVSGDPGMLEQVIMNLVVNARDSMPKGGRITISTDHVKLDESQVRTHLDARPGPFVCLTITDSGSGMDEETLKRIFEPFFTTKEAGKGTGLGLATVYGIASQHKGWVTVESQVGRGSSFRVFLPVMEVAAPAVAVTPEVQPRRGGTETILLVEDEESVRKTAGDFLRHCGYRVIEATNGMEAISFWTLHWQQINLLFTDMVMPGGFNGLQLAEKLRSAKPELKVLLSSGYSADLVQQSDLASKGILFVAKPCSANDLAAAIRRCLD